MNNEIERKFLVKKFDKSLFKSGISIIQGYIFSKEGMVVRVRTFDDKAYLTVKHRVSKLKRKEFEYEIPFDDALYMIKNCCSGILVKKRYIYYYENKKWEIDVFEGKNEGLILAEIELRDENEEFIKPDFLGEEVTSDPNYSNHNLAMK